MIALTPRSWKSDSVNIWLGITSPLCPKFMPSMPKSPSWLSLVMYTTSARSRTPSLTSSCSTLKVYSKAAPWQVQVPWPMPMSSVCRCPPFSRAMTCSNSLAASVACPAVQTDQVWPSGPSPGVAAKFSFGPGRVDEEVVLQLRDLALALRVGVSHRDVRAREVGAAVAVQFGRERLVELDALAPVDGGEGEGHLLGGHLADADPDVRGDPVPLRVGRDDDDVVLLAEHAPQVQGGGVAGNAGPQDDGATHGIPPEV